MVTSGASGAITLATAACLQYANNISPLAMPQAIDGLKNQVIVQQAHRYGYDHAMFLCGARVTEVVTLDDYKRACAAGNAIMTNFFNAAEEEDGIAGTAADRPGGVASRGPRAQYPMPSRCGGGYASHFEPMEVHRHGF